MVNSKTGVDLFFKKRIRVQKTNNSLLQMEILLIVNSQEVNLIIIEWNLSEHNCLLDS